MYAQSGPIALESGKQDGRKNRPNLASSVPYFTLQLLRWRIDDSYSFYTATIQRQGQRSRISSPVRGAGYELVIPWYSSELRRECNTTMMSNTPSLSPQCPFSMSDMIIWPKAALWYRITNSSVKASFVTLSTISSYSGWSASDCQSFYPNPNTFLWYKMISEKEEYCGSNTLVERSILFGRPAVLSPAADNKGLLRLLGPFSRSRWKN